jgi:hypothetical protein
MERKILLSRSIDRVKYDENLAKTIVENIRQSYQESWKEVAAFLQELERWGVSGYKLTGDQANPICIKLNILKSG